MWTCSVCETKNNDDDRFCACCGNARPASAAPKASRPVGNNQSGSASRPAASQNTPRAQSTSRTQVAEPRKKELSYEEKRLMELRGAVKIPENPSTRLNNHLGYWLKHLIGCFLLGTWAGALLSYLPVWIFGDLVEKLGGTPRVTDEMMEPFMAPLVFLCYILYWVMIIVRRKHAAEFRVMWKDGEIIARWHPIKDTHNLAVGLDGEWIALDPFVLNGSWLKQEGMTVGLRCAFDHRPGKAVIAQISVEGGTMKFTGAAYISVANVQ